MRRISFAGGFGILELGSAEEQWSFGQGRHVEASPSDTGADRLEDLLKGAAQRRLLGTLQGGRAAESNHIPPYCEFHRLAIFYLLPSLLIIASCHACVLRVVSYDGLKTDTSSHVSSLFAATLAINASTITLPSLACRQSKQYTPDGSICSTGK